MCSLMQQFYKLWSTSCSANRGMHVSTQKHRKQKKPIAHLSGVTDPVESAKAARLRYVSDESPGITRKQTRKGFRYFDPRGRPLREAEPLRRIKSLAIPPAWTDVWISALANGHL